MRRTLLVLLCVLALTGQGTATATVELPKPDTGQMLDVLDEDTRSLLKDVDPQQVDLGADSWKILRHAVRLSKGWLKSSLAASGQILAIVLLCALVSCEESKKLPSVVMLAGTLAIAAVGIAGLRQLQQQGTDALTQLQSFADLLLPVLSLSTATGGGVTAASALYAGTTLFIDVLIHIVTAFLQPMVYLYIALACADACVNNDSFTRLKDMVGWLIGGSLKVILFLFTAYLTVTGIISGSADATTVKAAKMTLSGVVPVVGSMISDASETIVLGASVLRNSLGVFGMIAALGICILPFLQTGLRYLLLKVTAAVAGLFGRKAHTELIQSLTTATGYLLAMTGACGLMLLVSFVCYIKVVTV